MRSLTPGTTASMLTVKLHMPDPDRSRSNTINKYKDKTLHIPRATLKIEVAPMDLLLNG